MKPTITSLSLAGALLATLGLPAAARAQYRLPVLVSAAKADSLHDAAVTLMMAHPGVTRPLCTAARRSSGRPTIPWRSGA